MFITKLVLEKYKRLLSSNVQRFEFTPTKTMQLIIGSNGAGKSSVLEELTPLPAHHSGFLKGGKKIFECLHQNKTYHLQSHYNGGSGHHSFICDGVEFNKGGTFAVQRELVEQTFGITREIHELLTGQTSFTGLSTAKRREWLTRMTPVSLDFAFSQYNTFKTLQRDQQGVIKHLTKRMALENQDLPDEAERVTHKNAIQQLTDKLNRLFEIRNHDVQRVFSSDDEMQETLNRLIRRGKDLLVQYNQLPNHSFDTETEHRDFVNQLLQKRDVEQSLLEQKVNEHETLVSQSPKRDDTLTEEAIKELRHQLDDYKQALTSIRIDPNQTVFPLVDLPIDRNPRQLLEQTYKEWITLAHNFPPNPDGEYTQDKGREVKEALESLKGRKHDLENKQLRLAQYVARVKGCESVVCPECSHSFKPGFTKNDAEKAESHLGVVVEQLESVNKDIQIHEEYIERFTDYLGFVRAFRRLVDNSDTSFKPLWDYCLEHRIMYTVPRDHKLGMLRWKEQMDLRLTAMELERNIELIEHRLRYVDAIDRDALSVLDQRRKTLESDIARQTHDVRVLNEDYQSARKTIIDTERLDQSLRNTIDEIEQFLVNVRRHGEYFFQDIVMEEVKQTQIELAQRQEVLSRFETRAGVLNDIQTQHEEAVVLQSDYALLTKAISPTDGLIGKQLMTFMQNITKLINAVISEIWTYPMEVLPSKIESEELDYKFPLNIKDGALMPPDISKGSSSQRDIIDFAFKPLVMKFLKLDNYPLYLDEFGSTFDEQHRHNLIPFINRMIENGQVQQVFFISHDAMVHGAFNQAEVCVLDPTNIAVPQRYNQHVSIQ